MSMPLVLAGASGFSHPFISALTVFLMAAFVGARLFSETSAHTLATRLSLLVGIAGVGTLGAIVVAASSGELFGQAAGAFAVALATGAALGGFLLTHTLLKGDSRPAE
jgi:hypothetical protein